MSHPYAESRKRARKKWRQSPKGKAWDKAYNQRPEVKARIKEYKIQKIIMRSSMSVLLSFYPLSRFSIFYGVRDC